MDAEVLAKVLDASLQPTAEYVADLEAGMAAASAELVAFREAAAVQREADGKVRSVGVVEPFRNSLLLCAHIFRLRSTAKLQCRLPSGSASCESAPLGRPEMHLTRL